MPSSPPTECEKEVDLSAITEYWLYNVVPIPRTAFEGVARVAPGEFVLWTEGGITKTRYWDMRYPGERRDDQITPWPKNYFLAWKQLSKQLLLT